MATSHIDILKKDIEQLLHDAQDLVREAKDTSAEKAEELRARASARLQQAIEGLHDLESAAVVRGKKIAADTNQYVHEKPWTAVGISAAVGVLLGLLIARR